MALIGLPLVLGASHLAVALVNWLATLLARPRCAENGFFQRNSSGIACPGHDPDDAHERATPEDLVEALEVRFLANRDEHLHFVLLTDFRDAPEETLPEDEPLLRLAQKRIQELNEKYRGPKADTFFLFHRPRRFNPEEQVWMGYEQRGKSCGFEFVPARGPRDCFSLIWAYSVLSNVKYVITLDTDTQLPRDSARQFVGAMAHPLNRARYNEDRQRIVRVWYSSATRCRKRSGMNGQDSAIMGSDPGIDPYTRVVSNIYQDLFGEGSFMARGSMMWMCSSGPSRELSREPDP